VNVFEIELDDETISGPLAGGAKDIFLGLDGVPLDEVNPCAIGVVVMVIEVLSSGSVEVAVTGVKLQSSGALKVILTVTTALYFDESAM